MKHHKDEKEQQEGGVGAGKEGGVLPSFTISLLTGFVCKWAERERERTKTLSCQVLWEQRGRGREAESGRNRLPLAEGRLHPPAWCFRAELTLQGSNCCLETQQP